VAGLAGHRRVCAGQRELELAVIKGGAPPVDRGVAHRAILRKSRAGVVGIFRVVEIGLVARDT